MKFSSDSNQQETPEEGVRVTHTHALHARHCTALYPATDSLPFGLKYRSDNIPFLPTLPVNLTPVSANFCAIWTSLPLTFYCDDLLYFLSPSSSLPLPLSLSPSKNQGAWEQSKSPNRLSSRRGGSTKYRINMNSMSCHSSAVHRQHSQRLSLS